MRRITGARTGAHVGGPPNAKGRPLAPDGGIPGGGSDAAAADTETEPFCIFCEVIAGRSPATIRYEDDEVVVFHNRLKWVPVMLLVVPRAHRSQTQMWTDPALLGKMGSLAVRFGRELCPGGYRLLSNFGNDALQSQDHAHLHVIGGAQLGIYVKPPGSPKE